MALNSISGNDLNLNEMLLLLNESSISILIEADGRIIAANRIFYKLSEYDANENNLLMTTLFSEESMAYIKNYKNRIIENVEKSQTIRIEDKQLQVELRTANDKSMKFVMDMVLLSNDSQSKWGYKLIDCKRLHVEKKQIDKMEGLKDSLLSLNQSLIKIKDIKNFYDLVLEAADGIVTYGEFCSILKLDEDDNFVPVAVRGYSQEVMENFKLPLKESFSWLKLGHKLDRTVIIHDLKDLYKKSHKNAEVDGHELCSSLQTPIFVDDELYGILTIDSTKENAFTEADLNIIEYLRTQIQVALQNQLLYNKMQHQASHDGRTGVANRGTFEERVIKFLSTKQDYETCCIIMMDLNDLKVVNDVWGHAAGDEYILNFVSVMKQHMRGSDLLARLGGDEFAIFLFSSEAAQFIERLEEIQKHFIDNPQSLDGHKVSCWFSYGISHCPEDGVTYHRLLNTADKRMYEMKYILKKEKQTNDLLDFRK